MNKQGKQRAHSKESNGHAKGFLESVVPWGDSAHNAQGHRL